jgi:hypothetical protein
MEIKAIVNADFAGWSAAEYLKLEKAVTKGVSAAGASLKAAWRAEVAAALGSRMGNTVKAKLFPEGQPSANAASLVYIKPGKPGRSGAPEIVGAHERGALIRARDGFWLAIPLPAAGKGKGGRRVTPWEWQARTGRQLRFISTGRRRGVLVADDARVNRKGRAVADRRLGKLQAARATTAVPIFALVPQVKLQKALNLMQLAETVGASLPARIAGSWEG